MSHIIVVANFFKIYQVVEAEQRMTKGSNIPFHTKTLEKKREFFIKTRLIPKL